MKDKIVTYLKESFNEFKKIRWLTPQETLKLTINIIIFTIIFSAFYGILDFIFSRAVLFLR